jgi:hypothetical protein
MLHSPAEYMVKYLCSQPGITVDQVKDYLSRSSAGIMPTETYVEEIHAEIQSLLPPNYNPKDFTHKPSMAFLKKQRIRGMWQRTQSMDEAIDLFKNGPVREIVEALLLTGMGDQNISELLSYFKAINVMASAISEFRHYFWNTELLTFDEWTYYLMKPSKQVVKLTALTAPKDDNGIHLALYKMGIMPKSLDRVEVFKSIRNIGYMNFLEANGFGQGEHKALMLSSYAGVVKNAQDKLDEYEAGEQDVINEFYKTVTVSGKKVRHLSLVDLQGETDEQGRVQGPVRELPPGRE